MNGYPPGVKLRLCMWLAQLLETFDDSLVALDDDVVRSSDRPGFGARV